MHAYVSSSHPIFTLDLHVSDARAALLRPVSRVASCLLWAFLITALE